MSNSPRTDELLHKYLGDGDHMRLTAMYGVLVELSKQLERENAELLAALQVMLYRYTSLVNSGDCGNWDPETESQVQQARAAILKALGSESR